MNLLISKYGDHFKLAFQLLGGYLVGYRLGRLIIRHNPLFLLMSLCVPLGLILFTYPRSGFYIIMFSVFFADWFKELGLIPTQMTWFPDVVLIVLTIKVAILKSRDKKFIRTPLGIPLLLFILVGVISMLINYRHILNTLVAFRFDLKFVWMYFLLVNLDPDKQFFRRMLRILLFLLFIQVPVALVKLTIYGQGESAIGTYGFHGGTYSTILPLVVINISVGLFLFEKPHLRYIFFALLFVLFSIVGGKRAFVFFGFLLFLFFFWHVGRKNLAKFSLVTPFLILGFLACIYFVPSLRPTFQNPRHLVDFTVSYSTQYSLKSGKAAGRASAIKEAYGIVKNNPITFLLGFGPGSLSKSYLQEYRGDLRNLVPIEYGHSQWVTMSLEYGFVGTLLFLWLFVPLYKLNQRVFNGITDNYWKAISFGFKGILFTYLMGFFYSCIFRGDVSAFIFWFFAATIHCLGKQKQIL